MAYNDLREYIEALEKEGEIQRIKEEVDWNLEIGAITRLCNEKGMPAPLAEKIKGYPEGVRIIGSPFGGSIINGKKMPFRRIAVGLEMDPESTYEDIVEEYIERRANPLKPVIVKEGSCKENIMTGDEVDLFKLPAPMVHGGDGGRYLCTFGATATKDPDSEWVNWGMYRAMIHTENKMGGIFLPMQHMPGMYYQKYEPRGISMPFAVTLGADPSVPFMATAYLPALVTEADIAGGIRKEPLQMVKCETNDLYVPATAEIIIEGEVRPNERWDEGPFGEFTGYRASPRMARPVYRVNCITHRKDPILAMSCMGMPVDDSASTSSIHFGVELTVMFREKGRPVTGVYSPPHGSNCAVVISSKIPYANFSTFLAADVMASKVGNFMHYIIICDDGTDISDLDNVFHDLVFKCHPVRGIRKVEYYPGMALDPYLDFHERQYGMGACTVIDCTWPKDWDPEIAMTLDASFRKLYPKFIQDRVLKRWETEYGFNKIEGKI